MGAVGGLLGMAGGAGGTGFSTTPGTNGQQINQAYTDNQNASLQQRNLLDAIQNQQGLQNQSNVYNQLQGVVSGQGPNPAQAMLNQATGANVANQAALMAGQRGASANPGLMARQAAQQGANLQQQAAGQGATMQANQSLNALGQAGNMANTQAANQIGQTNANIQSAQNEQNILQGANSNQNQIQGQLANTSLGNQMGVIGGLGNALGAATKLGSSLFADGGSVGGSAFNNQSMFSQALSSPSASPVPKFSPTSYHKKPASQGQAPKQTSMQQANANLPQGQQQFQNLLAPTGNSNVQGASNMSMAAQGGSVGDKLKQGGHVPGQAKESGNSYKNDTVKALLSPGEVVIPRSVMQSKDPIRGAADFVRAVMAKKGKK